MLPAEQTGAVRENYMWKILKSRADSWEGTYLAASSGCNDRDLFNTIWGPATAALSYIFERSEEKTTLLVFLKIIGRLFILINLEGIIRIWKLCYRCCVLWHDRCFRQPYYTPVQVQYSNGCFRHSRLYEHKSCERTRKCRQVSPLNLVN